MIEVRIVEQDIVIIQIDQTDNFAGRQYQHGVLRSYSQGFARYGNRPVNLHVGIGQNHQRFFAVGKGVIEKRGRGRVLQLNTRAKRILFILPQIEGLLAKQIAGHQIGDADAARLCHQVGLVQIQIAALQPLPCAGQSFTALDH